MQDNNKQLSITRRLNIVFLILVVVLFGFTLFFSDAFSNGHLQGMSSFDEAWKDEAGNTYNLSEVTTNDFEGGKVILSRQLPYYLFDGECICFESKNVNAKVYLNQRRIYEFVSSENMTGEGYGVAFHKVGISRQDAGEKITIEYSTIGNSGMAGRIFRVYIVTPADYIRWFINDKAILVASSVMILFFGLLLLILWLGIPDKKRQPFDVFSLGVASLFMGIWCLVNTNVIQILTEKYYFWHTVGTLIIPLIGFPFVVFYNSLSKRKKSIYNIMAFVVSVGVELTMILLRYVANKDMINLVAICSIFMFASDVVIMMIIYIENHYYCKKMGLQDEFKALNIGMAVLAISVIIDVVLWKISNVYDDTYGVCMRFGLVLFTIIMIIQFVSWWTKDQSAMDRDRFINRSLQFAVASKNPIESIKLLLEYLGKELEAKRSYIFEIDDNNKIRDMHEWFMDGLAPISQEFYDASNEKEIAKIKEIASSTDKSCFVVTDPETVKDISTFTYQIMTNQKLSNVVFSPIKSADNVIGFAGITDISPEKISGVYEIMKVLPYFFSQFINQRKEQERIIYYSYHDFLTGAKNRVAFKEFVSEKLDMSQAFGYVICEIDDLKEINTKLGHDVGDETVKNTVKSMNDVFGEDNVYRLSGETFVAFGFENDETYFDNDVLMLKRLLVDAGSLCLVAGAFCSNGTSDLDIVISHVYELLDKEKQEKALGE